MRKALLKAIPKSFQMPDQQMVSSDPQPEPTEALKTSNHKETTKLPLFSTQSHETPLDKQTLYPNMEKGLELPEILEELPNEQGSKVNILTPTFEGSLGFSRALRAWEQKKKKRS